MPFILTALAILLTLTALSLADTARLETPILNINALLPLLLIVWGLTLLAFAPARWQQWLSVPLKHLRGRVMALWAFILVYIIIVLAVLNLLYEAGRYTRSSASTDRFVLLFLVWLFSLILTFGLDAGEQQAIRQKLQTSRLTGLMISLTTLVVLFTTLDLGARLFLANSDGFGFTFMATNWLSRSWQPVNALGYRDFEISQNIPDGVQQVIVTGDSFAAGYGIPKVEDTFPHLLENRLGDGYQVHVVAQPGWAVDNELAALAAYPLQPDVLIVSHYIDDIRTTAQEHGLQHPITPYPAPPLSWLIGSFQLPNFVYWHVLAPRNFLTSYRDQFRQFVEASYSSPEIWSAYQDKLMQFVEITRKSEGRLVVLVWPDMQTVSDSTALTRPVINFFQANGADVIDMTADLLTLDPTARVANPYDFHPSIKVHQIAAARLLAHLTP
jgi:hypothetical protein